MSYKTSELFLLGDARRAAHQADQAEKDREDKKLSADSEISQQEPDKKETFNLHNFQEKTRTDIPG